MSESENAKKSTVTRARFPDVEYIKPEQPKDSDLVATPPSTVRDTYFAELFRAWMRDGKLSYDPVTHESIRELLEDFIRRTVAAKMVTEDISKSIQSTGVNIGFATKRIDALVETVLDIKLIGDITAALGFGAHSEDIVSREIDKAFGLAPIREAEKRNADKKAQETDEWMRNTLSGIHNMIRELSGTAKAVASRKPAPADPRSSDLALRAAHQAIASMRFDSQASEREPEDA